jgi:hypothetical protein
LNVGGINFRQGKAGGAGKIKGKGKGGGIFRPGSGIELFVSLFVMLKQTNDNQHGTTQNFNQGKSSKRNTGNCSERF